MIRTIPILLFSIILFCSHSKAAELQFFNTDVLGKSTSESITPLQTVTKTEELVIKPKIIQLDTDNDVYVAASIFYPIEEINFNNLVEILDIQYPNSKNLILSSEEYATWRVEDQKFAISLSSLEEDGHLRVIYIKFKTTEKVMENLDKTLKTIDNNCNDK